MPDWIRTLQASSGPDADMGAAYRRLLEKHVVEPWFPRCIDVEHGGFLCNFDRRWKHTGTGEKLLEFQARQTRTAAELLIAFPENSALRQAVSAGFSFLRDAMWDKPCGGWFLRTDRSGAPVASDDGVKHAHGMAYAIEACFAVHAATAEPGALELGLEAFEWVDAHSRDGDHGGYFGPMRRDGRRITAVDTKDRVDFIGCPIGLKDMDVNKDMLGAFALASSVYPRSTAIRARVEELLSIVLECFAEPLERPWFLFNPDWTPASTYWKPSEAVHLGALLVEARGFASNPEAVVDTAERLARQSFGFGWNDEAGALLGECDLTPLTSRQSRNVPWWAQFEFLRVAEYLAVLRSDGAGIRAIRDAARAAIGPFVDERHGGFTARPLGMVRLRDRLFRRPRWRDASVKGDRWKDASHEGRALLRLSCMTSEAPRAGPPLSKHAQGPL